MEEVEIWKEIAYTNGLYAISTLGNVKSFSPKWIRKYPNGKLLKTSLDKDGYTMAHLRFNGNNVLLRVNRLVWVTFNGETDLQVDHIVEGNKQDNRLSNLQLLTSRQNKTKERLSVNTSSKYIGVSFHKRTGKFQARMTINKREYVFGSFSDEIEAKNAYESALINFNELGLLPKLEQLSSKYKGVNSYRNKWQSRINIDKKRVYLGQYNTEIEAYNAILEYKKERGL